MKKALIFSLMCINVLLLLALVLGTTISPAKAQPLVGATDYMMIPARVQKDLAAVYIVDLGKMNLSALVLDKTTKKMIQIAPPRPLKPDFR